MQKISQSIKVWQSDLEKKATQPNNKLSQISLTTQQRAAVERYGNSEALLVKFSPAAKKFAMENELDMFSPGRTPQLRHVVAIYGEKISTLFLEAHIVHALDLLGIQTVADRRTTISSLAEVLIVKYSYLQLSEWLLFFAHLEQNSELSTIYSQPKIIRLLDNWVTYRNNQRAKSIAIQEREAREIDLSKCKTLEEYLSSLTPEELNKSSLKNLS